MARRAIRVVTRRVPAAPADKSATDAGTRAPRVTKVEDVKSLVARGKIDLRAVVPELHQLAASNDWQVREVAATSLVEIGKRNADGVLATARQWARSRDENVRRAASEGLRGIVKEHPQEVREILELLREDGSLYVKKSVANVLRNASRHHPEFVIGLCREWARSKSPNTRWIVKDGLRKLREQGSAEAQAITEAL